MSKKTTKIVLLKNPQYNYYEGRGDYSDDELLILKEYFSSAIGYDLSRASKLRDLISRGSIGGNAIGSEIIDGKVKLHHFYIENLKEPVLTQEELLALVDKWFELIAAKADQIVITNDNGKFSIGTE